MLNMTAFLTTLSESLPILLEGITDILNLIMNQPFLLFTVVFLFAGGLIGLLGRLLSRN